MFCYQIPRAILHRVHQVPKKMTGMGRVKLMMERRLVAGMHMVQALGWLLILRVMKLEMMGNALKPAPSSKTSQMLQISPLNLVSPQILALHSKKVWA
ncbi:hypothetical protein FRC11_014183, partial [Ceratobasidium sp. 423]